MPATRSTHLVILLSVLLSVLLILSGCPSGDDDADDDSAGDDDASDDDTGDDDTTATSCDDLECDENAHCDDSGEVPECVCNPGYAGDGFDCEEVAASLAGLRWELPCVAGHTGYSCAPQAPQIDDPVTLGGAQGVTYYVSLRFRGVVEQNSYSGGTQEDYWHIGGASSDGTYNIYSLTVSQPAQTFFLNAGTAGIQHCWPIDYVRTIEVEGYAEISLQADVQDYALIINQDESGDPIVIPDIPPYPDPFDGQFIQMDVVSVALTAP